MAIEDLLVDDERGAFQRGKTSTGSAAV